MTFHPNQITTGKEIIDTMVEGWVFYMILLAQMQSGKTGTYLKVAFDAIRLGIVETVLIISGSRDTSLRGQAQADLTENINEYAEEISETIQEYRELIQKLSNGVNVFWSQDLKTITELKSKTLIIHEESHAAQSKTNKPYMDFYLKHNIEKALYGDLETIEYLKDNKIWILNVSATPFSEIIANFSADDGNRFNKKIFFAEPGDSYIGINTLLDQENIKFESKPISEDSTEFIIRLLNANKSKYDKKYCIIRTKCAVQDEEMMRIIAKHCEYGYRNVFATQGSINPSEALKFLESEPEKATIVHICGKARMGQVLSKEYIGMVYEQSINPNTDTILQGLLGRMCGYYTSEIPDIYISEKKQDEIQVYADAWSESSIHKFEEIEKAMNIKGKYRKHQSIIKTDKGVEGVDGEEQDWIQIHPIELNIRDFKKFIVDENGNPVFNSLNISDIKVDQIDFGGNVDEFEIKRLLNKPELCHKRSNICKKMYTEKYPECGGYLGYIEKCIEENERCNPVTLFPEKSFTSDFKSIQMIGSNKTDTNQQGKIINPQGKIFIVGYVKYNADIHPQKIPIMPVIHEKANYIDSVENEDGTVIENINGGQIIRFPFETTSNSLSGFETKLRESIKRTILGDVTYIEECCKSINSIYCNGKKEYTGIYIKMDLVKGGVLGKMEKRLNDEFPSINLKFPSFVKTDMPGYRRMTSVTW